MDDDGAWNRRLFIHTWQAKLSHGVKLTADYMTTGNYLLRA